MTESGSTMTESGSIITMTKTCIVIIGNLSCIP
jgi:hypothetical protein